MAIASPVSTAHGAVSTVALTSFVSRGPSRLPRYSGVRPIIRPPRNTASRAMITRPYSPLPAPPGLTSPSIMFAIRTPPPRLVKLSYDELAAPSAVAVAAWPKRALPGTPNRTSVPSVAAPTAVPTVLCVIDSNTPTPPGPRAEQDDDHRQQRPAFPSVAHHEPVGAHQRHRNEQHENDLD